jgi:hypothetical protein
LVDSRLDDDALLVDLFPPREVELIVI